MADVNGLVNDPDFQKLDPASQRQALTRVTGDQSFSQLSDADTASFISRMTPYTDAQLTDGTTLRFKGNLDPATVKQKVAAYRASRSTGTSPGGQQTLAQSVRAKYPGAYDDLDDYTLEQKVLSKYPQYSDMPRSAPGPDIFDQAANSQGGDIFDQISPTVNISGGRDVSGLRKAAAPLPVDRGPNFRQQGKRTLAAALPWAIGTTAGVLGGPFAPETGALGVGLAHVMEPAITGEGGVDWKATARDMAISEGGGRILSAVPYVPGLASDAKDALGRFVREPGVVDPTTGDISPGSLRPGVKAVASVGKIVGGPQIADAVLPNNPDIIGYQRMSANPNYDTIAGMRAEQGAIRSAARDAMNPPEPPEPPEPEPVPYRPSMAAQLNRGAARAYDPLSGAATGVTRSPLPWRSMDPQVPELDPQVPESTATPRPLRPSIATPEDWAAYDQRMQNLKAEASDAGTYSAARGKVGRKLNYQQRIGKSFPWSNQ